MLETTSNNPPNDRLNKTSRERTVLALEMIADELLLICRQLEIMTDREEGARKEPASDERPVPTQIPLNAAPDENGIIRGQIETFSVGSYRYTKLEEALAEIKRSRSVAEKEIEHLMSRKLG